MSDSKRDLNKWRREADSLRKKLRKLNAELDAIERLEPSQETAERITKQRAEIVELLDQLARIKDKIDSYESPGRNLSLDDFLFMTAFTLGILIFLLILYVFVFPIFFSK